MATYAIGDVQGCFSELKKLTKRVRFDPKHDQLWFVGDLVNRGPRSLDVLRFVRDLGDKAVTVIGNHDIHLLGCAAGVRKPKAGDTFEDVLEAKDRDELIHWLEKRPFLYREGDYVMVHAGLHPSWDADTAAALAAELERAFRKDPRKTLEELRSRPAPLKWESSLKGADRLRAIATVLTRMRACSSDGTLEPEFSGPPDEAPSGFKPWFDWPGKYASEVTVVCGHWSALGLRVEPHVIALDTGCVWGRALTAVRLDDGVVFMEPAAGR
jgi:bis(5'-nucleosyl)-tetraphosphatase (symmetrical)